MPNTFARLSRPLLWFALAAAFTSQACTSAAPTQPLPSAPNAAALSTTTPGLVNPSNTPLLTSTSFPTLSTRTRVRPTFAPSSVTPVRPTVVRTIPATRTAPPTRTSTSPSTVSARPPGPSRVAVQQTGTRFQLLVNGQPTFVTGMNYNVNYTGLSVQEQLRLHRRDFKIMHDAGVNAIVGWGIYDEYTLDVADEYGIGVIMPFDLDPQGAYDNQNYVNELKTNFRDYILRFRDFPAVWGWNPGGDELLYRMETEEHRTADKLQTAADVELQLARLAFSLDPNHISVVKEPRDWYIHYLGDSLKRAPTAPGSPNPGTWLVYGANVYGHPDDIQLALTNGRLTLTGQLGLAMLVTEFGPFNSPPAERALDYADIWDVVARASELGGLVYVFGPDQPNPKVANPYDVHTLLPSQYSLVDMNGTPVDDSLAVLAAKWHALAVPSGTPRATGNPTAAPTSPR